MTQSSIAFEERARDKGMTLAGANNALILAQFRGIAASLGERGRPISVEDVREEALRRGLRFTPGNWMGNIFREGGWQHVGYRKASHKGSHARPVGLWVLE